MIRMPLGWWVFWGGVSDWVGGVWVRSSRMSRAKRKVVQNSGVMRLSGGEVNVNR